MDTAVSKDKKIVLSHEPWFSSEICSLPDGKPVTSQNETNHLIYNLNYEEIEKFDCGKRGHPRFVKQKPMEIHKPLLRDVVTQVNAYLSEKTLPPVQYNIEIKTEPKGDAKYHPGPQEFAQLLYNEIKELGILKHTIIQSFDVRALQAMRKIDPQIPLAFLVENKESFLSNIKKLGFNPEIYSPDFQLITPRLIEQIHWRKMKLIPWTVNKIEDMKHLKEMGVDGLITDYPDLAKFLIKKD